MPVLPTRLVRSIRRYLPPSVPAAAALALLAACGPGGGDARTVRSVALADSVAADATLALDSLERAWIGEPGRITVIDSVGRPVARLAAGGALVPRVLWVSERGAVVRAGGTVAVIDTASEARAGTRRSDAPVARDPRGRWVYTVNRGGGVLGLVPGTLAPRWGWPDAGSRAPALAVSPLGDRVYVALEGSDAHGVKPSIEVRDAQSGRLLSTFATSAPVRLLEVGPGAMLYALAGSDVVALRHGPQGLAQAWSTGTGTLGLRRVDGLRVSPAGGRVAVVARDRGVRVLDARTGEVVVRTDEAPRDAAFDVGGRLWVLYAREIRIVR